MTPQRELGTAVVACLGGAAIAIYGATRVWSVQVTERPGLTSLRATTTGAAHQPWLIGLALVALAGAGALLATRGLARRGLGGVLTLVGAALIAAAITGRASLDAGAAGAGASFWPVACAAGGALVAWGGVSAARHGHRWPAMGSRYDRRPASSSTPEPAAGQPAGLTAAQEPASVPRQPVGSAAATTCRPATATTGRPATATTGRPATATTGRPATATTGRPATATTGRPATATTGRPATATTGRPAAAATPPAAAGDRPAPGDSAPGLSAPGDSASADRAPGDSAAGDSAPGGGASGDRPDVISPNDARAAWDALDRGDDPT